MVVKLKKRKLANYVNRQVESGRYQSADAAIEDAVERMMLDSTPTKLTARDRAAIREADQQIARGEMIDFDVFARRIKRKFGIR